MSQVPDVADQGATDAASGQSVDIQAGPDSDVVTQNDGSRTWRLVRLGALIAGIVLLGVSQGVSMLIVVASIVVMIFLHELGHFVMAKRAGMLATEFFIGFGPRIFSFRRGETEYGLKVIPAGAYVRIIGMNSMEQVDPALESRTYRQKSFWQRFGVAVAGSTMHFIIALLLLFTQFAIVGSPDGSRWSVAAITTGSAAEAAGIRHGDEIVSFDGEKVTSFNDFRHKLADVNPGRIDLEVVRDGEELTVPIDLSTRTKIIGTVGEDIDVVDTGEHMIVGDPLADGRVDKAGIRGGEFLIAVDGTPVSTLHDVAEVIAVDSSGELSLTTSDSTGTSATHTVDLGTSVATTQPTAFVGVGSDPIMARDPVPVAAWEALKTFGSVTKASIVGVGQFVWPPNLFGFVSRTVTGSEGGDRTDTPTVAADTPLGQEAMRPISIVGVAMLGSDLSSQSAASFLQFMALINIFFGVFNLFPLLPFDGGHVVIAIYEKVREIRNGNSQRYLSDVSRMAPIAYLVIAVLAVVGLLAMFVDITQGVNF